MAGFSPMAGASGRVKSILVPDDTTTDLPVVGALTTVTAPEIVGWTLQRRVEGGKVVTVESPADGNRVVSTLQLRGGIGSWSAKIDYVVNADTTAGATSDARLPVGAFIKFDLMRHKTSAYGHRGCVGKIVSDDSQGAKNDANPQTASITVEGHGLLPDPTFS